MIDKKNRKKGFIYLDVHAKMMIAASIGLFLVIMLPQIDSYQKWKQVIKTIFFS